MVKTIRSSAFKARAQHDGAGEKLEAQSLSRCLWHCSEIKLCVIVVGKIPPVGGRARAQRELSGVVFVGVVILRSFRAIAMRGAGSGCTFTPPASASPRLLSLPPPRIFSRHFPTRFLVCTANHAFSSVVRRTCRHAHIFAPFSLVFCRCRAISGAATQFRGCECTPHFSSLISNQ
jgi:hypothetical protein